LRRRFDRWRPAADLGYSDSEPDSQSDPDANPHTDADADSHTDGDHQLQHR
jgi:hypothetical protein